MNNFDSQMARRLAECARLSYFDQKKILEHEPNSQFFEKGHTQGFMVREEYYDLLIFRGTEPNNSNDWWTDLKITNTDYQFHGDDEKYDIHHGFFEALNLVDEQIKTLRSPDPEKPIYVSGHSLGGALATLWVANNFDQPARIAGLYTFGSPRVGSANFAKKFDRAFRQKTWRFQNRLDMVTRVPSVGCRHVGQLLYFDFAEKLVLDPSHFFIEWRDKYRNIIASRFKNGSKTNNGCLSAPVIRFTSFAAEYYGVGGASAFTVL